MKKKLTLCLFTTALAISICNFSSHSAYASVEFLISKGDSFTLNSNSNEELNATDEGFEFPIYFPRINKAIEEGFFSKNLIKESETRGDVSILINIHDVECMLGLAYKFNEQLVELKNLSQKISAQTCSYNNIKLLYKKYYKKLYLIVSKLTTYMKNMFDFLHEGLDICNLLKDSSKVTEEQLKDFETVFTSIVNIMYKGFDKAQFANFKGISEIFSSILNFFSKNDDYKHYSEELLKPLKKIVKKVHNTFFACNPEIWSKK